MKIDIGISEQNRDGVAKILNGILADEQVLLIKTKKYHWNVTGPHFPQLHKFFDEQYESISGFVDDIAERIRGLGSFAAGSMADYLKIASIKEDSGGNIDAQTMVQNLLENHEALIKVLRKDVSETMEKHGDAGTSDFLTGLMEEHEKTAWMLRATLSS